MASVNSPYPVNPFFEVPDLSADGDFEVLGVNVHHGSSPTGNPFFLGIMPDPNTGGKDGDERTRLTDISGLDTDTYDFALGADTFVFTGPGGGFGGGGGGDSTPGDWDGTVLIDLGGGTNIDGDARKPIPGFDANNGDLGGDVTITANRDNDAGATFHIDAGIYDGPSDHPGGDTLPGDSDANSGLFLDVFLPKSFDPSDGGTIRYDPTGDFDASSNGCDYSFLEPYIPYLDNQLIGAIYAVLQDVNFWQSNPFFVTFALATVASDFLGAKGLLKGINSPIPAVGDFIDFAIEALAHFIAEPATDLITSTLGQVSNYLNQALNNAEAQAIIDAINALAEQNGCVPISCIKKYSLYMLTACTDTGDNDSIAIKLGDPTGQAVQINRNFVSSSNLQIPQLPSSPQSNKGLVHPFFNIS